jgi:hypothetical protein
MAVTLISFVACPTKSLTTWRPEDYAAYKLTRALAGRRVAGSAWVPDTRQPLLRLSNASEDAALCWFMDRAIPYVQKVVTGDRRPVLVPVPGANRIVGAPPSRGRALAQELSARTGFRVLDVLRWRQKMPRCQPTDPQTFADNVVLTAGLVRADCILIADFVRTGAAIQAIAARLRQAESLVLLALAAGRAADPPPVDPFAAQIESIDDTVERTAVARADSR